MKFFSSLVLLVQLSMLGSIAQAAFPSDDLLSFTTRELVQELQARIDIAAPYLSNQHARRSIAYDDFVEFSARGGGKTSGTPGSTDPTGTGDTTAAGGAVPAPSDDGTTDSTGGGATSTPPVVQDTTQGGGIGGTGHKGSSHHRGHRLMSFLTKQVAKVHSGHK